MIYQRFSLSGCKDIVIRKVEFLCYLLLDLMAAEAQTSDPVLAVKRSNKLDLGEVHVALCPDIYVYNKTRHSYVYVRCL